LKVDELQEVLLSDTVGFIRKLPHHLIEAFKATLEELAYADVLLHVIDLSNPEWQTQASIVDKLIAELGAEGTPCVRVYNKCDAYLGVLPRENDAVCISARTGEGTAELLAKVSEILGRSKHRAVFRIPYSQGALVQALHDEAAVLSTDYAEDGTVIEAIVKPELWARVRQYAEGDRE
ncbi:MAG: 50S ribosome-binding GTPase, partial [Clostridia bacterium]|nr:50S ribosome-binding GTPase [Clostridia bacterium]